MCKMHPVQVFPWRVLLISDTLQYDINILGSAGDVMIETF